MWRKSEIRQDGFLLGRRRRSSAVLRTSYRSSHCSHRWILLRNIHQSHMLSVTQSKCSNKTSGKHVCAWQKVSKVPGDIYRQSNRVCTVYWWAPPPRPLSLSPTLIMFLRRYFSKLVALTLTAPESSHWRLLPSTLPRCITLSTTQKLMPAHYKCDLCLNNCLQRHTPHVFIILHNN